MADEISPPNAKLPQMWEISTRPWLYSLSQKYQQNITKLSEIPMEEFQNLRNKGMDIVWLMGLWKLGEYGLHFDQTNSGLWQVYNRVLPGWKEADVIGSPYAVWSYDLNPELGSMADLVALKTKLNQMGLKLMVDFVPNHSAVDSPWASEHPSYYVQAPKGSVPPLDPNRYYNNSIALGSAGWWGSSWMDTLQYNYWNLDFRKAQTERLVQVASVADYIRCDMAYLCLNDQVQDNWGTQLASWGYTRPSSEFWADAIKATKAAYPHVQFLAEVYDPWGYPLQSLGFDFTYDKHLYDLLGNGNLDNLRGYLANTDIGYLSKGAHFVENHDEPRAADFFGSNQRADGAAMVALTVPGMRFYNEGQQDGYRNRLQVQLRRAASEPIAVGVPQFYDILTPILARPVFHTGTWTYLSVFNDPNSWRLMAWKWTNNDERLLVVVNYSDSPGAGAIILSDAQPVNGNDTIPVTDLISQQTWMRSANQMQSSGLFTVIQPWSCQILKYW
jgi:hypothetical protein